MTTLKKYLYKNRYIHIFYWPFSQGEVCENPFEFVIANDFLVFGGGVEGDRGVSPGSFCQRGFHFQTKYNSNLPATSAPLQNFAQFLCSRKCAGEGEEHSIKKFRLVSSTE